MRSSVHPYTWVRLHLIRLPGQYKRYSAIFYSPRSVFSLPIRSTKSLFPILYSATFLKALVPQVAITTRNAPWFIFNLLCLLLLFFFSLKKKKNIFLFARLSRSTRTWGKTFFQFFGHCGWLKWETRQSQRRKAYYGQPSWEKMNHPNR